MKQTIFGMMLLGFLAMSFSGANKMPGIQFNDGNLNEVSRKANDEEKPIFIFVGAPFCNLSQRMNRIFNNKEVGNYFNEHFVCKMMDASTTFNNLRLSNWGVTSVPSFIYMDSQKHIIYKSTGYKDEDDLIAEAGKVLSKIEADQKLEEVGE